MYSSRLAIFTSAFLIGIQVSFLNGCDFNMAANESTNQYQPLYVTKKNNGYSFADSVTYNLVMKQQTASGDRNKLLAACSETPNTDRLLNIMPVDEQQIANGFRCNTPVEFFVKQRFRRASEHYLIGFMIYDDSGISSENNFLLTGIPTTIFPVSLIKVALRKLVEGYVNVTTWHDIKYASMLPMDGPSDDRLQNQEHYGKNILIYGYDIDPAYQQINQLKFIKTFFKSETDHAHKLVKLQLAPVDDFFFDVWKQASFNNINTTSVWDELIPEWRQFEKFIRRVADVVGDLQIITGGVDPYIIFEPGNDSNVELYKLEHSTAPALRVFEKIFKAISFNQKCQDNQWIRQGIVFTMINDPRKDYNSHDTFALRNGWNYLQDRKLIPKIRAKAMNPDSMKELGVIISYAYEPFNLNLLKKLSKNDRNEEIVIEVDVVGEMFRKSEFPSDFITGMEIS